MTLPNENALSSVRFESNNVEIGEELLGACGGDAQMGAPVPKLVPNSTAIQGMGEGQSFLHLRYLCSIIRRQSGAIVLDAIAIDLIVAV